MYSLSLYYRLRPRKVVLVRKIFRFQYVTTLFLLVFCSLPVLAKNQGFSRFEVVGDGHLKIKNVKTGFKAEVNYLTQEGEFDAKALEVLSQVFQYPQKTLGESISKRTIAMLDYFSDELGKGKWIFLNSGYRSPKYNKGLRQKGRGAAKTSTHMDGMALDFYIPGVDGKVMWEFIRKQDCCGAGHYGGQTVHLDSGRPRFWEAGTSKVKTNASAFNRYIYGSTEYDVYKKDETIRFFFTSISDFGFGLKSKVKVLNEAGKKVATFKLKDVKESCYKIDERKKARFLYVDQNLKEGTYQLKFEFCDKVAKEMPSEKMSNLFIVTN